MINATGRISPPQAGHTAACARQCGNGTIPSQCVRTHDNKALALQAPVQGDPSSKRLAQTTCRRGDACRTGLDLGTLSVGAEPTVYSRHIIMNAHSYRPGEQDVPVDVPVRKRSRRIVWVVVLGLVALVAVALLLPATRTAREAARRVSCSNNLRQITLALGEYAKAHGHLPPARMLAADGTALHSWRTLILPYLEENRLFESIDLSKPWDDPVNAAARETVVSVFQCPSSSKDGPLTTYQAVILPEGLFRPDGTASLQEFAEADPATVIVIDSPSDRAVHWMEPSDVDADAFLVGLRHSSDHSGNVLLMATVDGRVLTFFADDENVMAADSRALLTPAKDGPDFDNR